MTHHSSRKDFNNLNNDELVTILSFLHTVDYKSFSHINNQCKQVLQQNTNYWKQQQNHYSHRKQIKAKRWIISLSAILTSVLISLLIGGVCEFFLTIMYTAPQQLCDVSSCSIGFYSSCTQAAGGKCTSYENYVMVNKLFTKNGSNIRSSDRFLKDQVYSPNGCNIKLYDTSQLSNVVANSTLVIWENQIIIVEKNETARCYYHDYFISATLQSDDKRLNDVYFWIFLIIIAVLMFCCALVSALVSVMIVCGCDLAHVFCFKRRYYPITSRF